MIYNREAAVAYAHEWAFSRNPDFYSFDDIGGDCTNFASQCIYAGAGVMNFTRNTGWYYISPSDRAAAWTGVAFLHKFLINNTGPGPFAAILPLRYAQPGDVIQLSSDGEVFTHSLVVVRTRPKILVAAHSKDADMRPLHTYNFRRLRLLHIEGVNPPADSEESFEERYNI